MSELIGRREQFELLFRSAEAALGPGVALQGEAFERWPADTREVISAAFTAMHSRRHLWRGTVESAERLYGALLEEVGQFHKATGDTLEQRLERLDRATVSLVEALTAIRTERSGWFAVNG